MSDLDTFKHYLNLENQLAAIATKDDLMHCARLMAMNIAHYELTFGTLPLEESLACLEAEAPSAEQLTMLNHGMQTLVGLLGNVIQGLEQKTVN